MAQPRWRGSSWLTTRPPIAISPPETSSSPAISRSRVDLPQPDGPSTTTNSPSRMSRSTPCTISVRPKLLRSPRMTMSAMPVLFFGRDQAAHEPALHQHDDDERRQHDDQRAGHGDVPVGNAERAGNE